MTEIVYIQDTEYVTRSDGKLLIAFDERNGLKVLNSFESRAGRPVSKYEVIDRDKWVIAQLKYGFRLESGDDSSGTLLGNTLI